MEGLIAAIIVGVVGVGIYVSNSNRKAAQLAHERAEDAARRRRVELEHARRKQQEQEAKQREIERKAAFRQSVETAIRVAVRAAIEATIIGAEIANSDSKVIHIVASAFEAAGVAESIDAGQQTRSGQIPAALQLALADAITRSNAKATEAARGAASLESALRSKLVSEARISATEATIAIAIMDGSAILRANDDYKEIKKVRMYVRNSDIMAPIREIAHEIEEQRSREIRQTIESENDRLEAIIDAIDPANSLYADVAYMLASNGRAAAIKSTRKRLREVTTERTISKSIEAVTQNAESRLEAIRGSKIAQIMAMTAPLILDMIEDAVEDGVALTRMRTGLVGDAVDPSIASVIQVSTENAILKLIETARAITVVHKDRIEFIGDNRSQGVNEESATDELPHKLNVPRENYEQLPKLESPAGYVYVIQDTTHTGYCKIGRTTHPMTRMNKFGVELPFHTEVIAILKASDAARLEGELHDQFAQLRRNGEWFELDVFQLLEICRM